MASNSNSNGVAGLVLLGIIGIVWLFIKINNSTVVKPELSIDGATKSTSTHEIRITDEYTKIYIKAGSEAKTCSKDNNFSLTVNGDIVEDNTCYHTIKNNTIPNGETTYEIVAKNKSGEDKLTLKVTKNIEKKDSPSSSTTSSGLGLQTAAHLNCKNYANEYFFPHKASLENVLDGNSDNADGDGWIYRPLAKVTSSSGGTIWYQVVCKTDKDGHVTSFAAWQ